MSDAFAGYDDWLCAPYEQAFSCARCGCIVYGATTDPDHACVSEALEEQEDADGCHPADHP